MVVKNTIVGSKREGWYYADKNGVCCESEEMRLAAEYMMTYCKGDTLDQKMKSGFLYMAKNFPYHRTYDHPKKAAVESGADAIYLSGKMFGARAYANNFDEQGLKEAIEFAHLRNVKIHVTVNTLVDNSEIPALADYFRFLYEIGADAVLVQDLGAARLAQLVAPDLPLHASTQMTVNNLAGVLALQELGFSRVVLSREVTLKDIIHICRNSDVEIEVFAHGALCVCYSGQCLMSSMIGGRSGNRGRCAQPCRLPYTLVDKNNNNVLKDAGQYLLSPRDMNTRFF